jgi:hypothetical protein
MKPSHLVFNILTLLIAVLLVVSLLGAWFLVMPSMPADGRNFWHFIIAFEVILILTLGGGGIANFAMGRLAPWPTGIIIAGYCISMWLFPLAIWGLVALLVERKRKNRTVIEQA